MAIVKPYAKPPAARTVAVAVNPGECVLETGELLELRRVPADVRVYADDVTVRRWFAREHAGELFEWQDHAYRWRPDTGRGWKPLPGDVYLLRTGEAGGLELLDGLRLFRDWLTGEGATLNGSMGSAAMSLLRARLERPWWTRGGEMPPVETTFGGRQELGWSGPGAYTGDIRQLDLPAAYASTLAGTPYGYTWRRMRSSWLRGRWSSSGLPVFVRARVKIAPGVGYAPGRLWPPLPTYIHRGRRRSQVKAPGFLFVNWWAEGRRQGTWPAAELEAALELEAVSLDQILDVWAHFPEARFEYPLEPWWRSVQAGRELGGIAGLLAKQAGNALWGQLCINPHGKRRIRVNVRGARGWRGVPQELPRQPFGRRRAIAPELAEHVAGQVRARLYRMMVAAGPRLLAAHTDGCWIDCSGGWASPAPGGWRVKQAAEELRLVNPQTFAYLAGGEWRYAVSGATEPGPAFEQAWEQVCAKQ